MIAKHGKYYFNNDLLLVGIIVLEVYALLFAYLLFLFLFV